MTKILDSEHYVHYICALLCDSFELDNYEKMQFKLKDDKLDKLECDQ